MANRDFGAERCYSAAELKMRFEEMARDRRFTDQELDELEDRIVANYLQTELEALAKDARVQLENIPDTFPNRPMRMAVGQVVEIIEGFDKKRAALLRQQQAA